MGSVVVLVVALAVSIRCVLAREYVVGEGECPELWSVGCEYESWAAQYKFLVGDTLEFRFDVDLNSVALVSKVDYDDCNSGVSVDIQGISYATPTRVALSSTGSLYFVSVDGDGSCNQKLAITVESSTTTTSSSSSALDPSPRRSSSSGNANTVKKVVGVLVSYALLLGTVSLVVYCIVHRRRQQQLLQVLGAPLPNETSPVLYADGENNVDVNDQGEYVPHQFSETNYPAYNLDRHERATNQLGQIG